VREEIIKYIQQNQIFLTTHTNAPMPQRKPMSAQEFKFMREQQMRGADISTMRPQSPSQQNELSEDDWV
jgi:hypothetical protein